MVITGTEQGGSGYSKLYGTAMFNQQFCGTNSFSHFRFLPLLTECWLSQCRTGMSITV